MNYEEYASNANVISGKANAYKNHIIKNIEIIGQRKLVIIGGGKDYDTLLQTLDQQRKKGVKVPEIAFRAVLRESDVNAEEDIRFIDELKGKSSSFYVLIVMPYVAVETQLAAMANMVGTSAEAAQALKNRCGYTDRDFCEMNESEDSGLKGAMGHNKAASGLNSDAKAAASMQNSTSAQLSGYKGKKKGSRCFIVGSYSAKLDELNAIFNETAIACNDICDFFNKTPQRPYYYLLTEPAAYLGNGKHIESMECFVNGDVRVFEDKFKKKPTYLNHLGNGIVDGLPSFSEVQKVWETSRIMPLYEMLQIMLYMGFSEIYIYGFDGIFKHNYDENGVGGLHDGAANFPAKARQLLERVNTYANNNGMKIINLCATPGLAVFETKSFADVDFTSSSIFGRI